MHFHRDMLAVCDGYARNVLRATAEDRFIGSAPLAFTFGFGGVLFPMHVGASFVVLEKAGPDDLLPAIAHYRATVCFTAPTSYRAMLGKLAGAWLTFVLLVPLYLALLLAMITWMFGAMYHLWLDVCGHDVVPEATPTIAA
jgi:acyl-CoA synthetase (AMP-forming)/AMP-acid ligase II